MPILRSPLHQSTRLSSQVSIPSPKDHVKYEFIEKLLRTPDLSKTQQTINEMMNLYQEIVEKTTTIADQSKDQQVAGPFSGNASSMLNSQQSIVVHTDHHMRPSFGQRGPNDGLQSL